MAGWLGRDLSYKKQGQGDLGDRQALAFEEAFKTGMARVILIGTDCPARDEHNIGQAFDYLIRHDLVLGPANDGGYYLIGLRIHFPPLFENIPWGTESVFEQTVAIAHERGLSTAFLATLDDVDRPEDLEFWETESRDETRLSLEEKPVESFRKTRDPDVPRISVIVPTLNEASLISQTLTRINQDDNVEMIVVDGRSQDQTPEVARALGATVVRSRRGRAPQMNTGADKAAGEILLFLHADTLLPEGWVDRVREISAWPNTAGGAFELRLDTTLRWSRSH